MRAGRSDVEIVARTRVLAASVAIYLLCMAFMALTDRLYVGHSFPTLARLAVLPFFVLLLLRWLRLVRVLPPPALREARQLLAHNRHQAARDAFASVLSRTSKAELRRIDRARRLLHGPLAIPLALEARYSVGRCSLQLGELERATQELRAVCAELPLRAEVALDLAEAYDRQGNAPEAAAVLQRSLPAMDATDRETLAERPALRRLLGDTPLPRRSRFSRRIQLERLLLALLVAVALLHGMHFYLQLF